jgi:glycosyltransferase involved in cell wall biosynthesis
VGEEKRAVRVLHVAEAFGGGLLDVVVCLAAGAVDRGHSAAIAYGVRPETPDDVRAAVPAGVDVRQIEGWGRRRPQTERSAVRQLRQMAADFRPDVIHLHSSFAGVTGLRAFGDLDVPMIFTPHAFASCVSSHSAAARRAYSFLERRICKRVDSVGAVSHSEAEVARRYGARNVVCIFNGTSASSERERAPLSRPVVVASGRTVSQRRPHEAASILSGVSSVSDVAWIGGGDERTRSGQASLIAAGIPVTGWLPRQEALDHLAHANIYLHWTAWDGLPVTVLEAIAMGTVVVASDIPPNREILGDRALCSTRDDAVRMIRSLLADPGELAALAEYQRRRCERFSWEQMVDGWLDHYTDLLGDQAPREVIEPAPAPAPALALDGFGRVAYEFEPYPSTPGGPVARGRFAPQFEVSAADDARDAPTA